MRDFEKRLSKARRYNRPQYLRIKAVSLSDLGSFEADSTAVALLQRIIDEYPEIWHEVNFAHEKLGHIYHRRGNYAESECEYRIVVRSYNKSRSGTSGVCDLTLAELIVETKQQSKFSEAADLLTGAAESGSIVFAQDWFRYWVAAARLANATGRLRDAADFAKKALARAEDKTLTFARHPTVGNVRAHPDTLNEMRMLADAGSARH